jgi:hypothetical protein
MTGWKPSETTCTVKQRQELLAGHDDAMIVVHCYTKTTT